MCAIGGWVQSLMFLLAAESFKTFLEEAPTAKTTGGYARYIALVDKHIRERSPYEVNIESKIRREILRTTDKEIFEALTVVRLFCTCMRTTPSAESIVVVVVVAVFLTVNKHHPD